jgi:hypothetical protein
MDKEVKRALILWPAIAATAIVAASTLPRCWHTQPQSDRNSQLAISSSTIARVVRIAHSLLHPFDADVDDHDSSPHRAMLLSDDLASSSMSRSLRAAAPTHRPDCGLRGLAAPNRLTGQITGVGTQAAAGDFVSESGRSLAPPADLTASSQVIARTLLAPVLDPVAELAGYSGRLARTGAGPVLPSIFSPGVEDPFAATGRNPAGTRAAWMTSLNPIASWEAIESDQVRVRTLRNDETLIPRNVLYLAKPSREIATVSNELHSTARSLKLPVSANVGNPVTWPQPKQLRHELALIAADADLLRVLGRGSNHDTLTSVEMPAGHDDDSTRSAASKTLLRELVAGGNRGLNNFDAATSLERQASAIVMGRWANNVDKTLNELRELPRIGDERSGRLIRNLAALAEAGLQLAERVPARDQQIRWLRASHALSRRAAVWGPIWQLARESGDENVTPNSQVATSVPGAELFGGPQGYSLVRFQNEAAAISTHVADLVVAVREKLSETGDVEGWNRFLLLNEIETAAVSDDADERALLAQRFLSRLNHYSLQGEHRQWLQQDAVMNLASVLQSWTAQPIDYARLLSDLERGETDSIDLAAIKVSEVYQSLRFSDSLDAARVAKAIDVTYRNANVRAAISVDLISRLLPAVPTRTEPINTTLLGNQVRGTSTVNSQLSLQLQPSADSWNIDIGTHGDVATRSHSGQSGVSVMSSGQNVFQATTPLIIRPDGYRIGQTQINVTGTQQLSGIRNRYEGWPLVGSLVRGIAESRFEQARPIAQRVSNEKIRTQVTAELQSQLTDKTTDAEAKLDDFVFGPLGRLDLEPRVIDLQTTAERLVARYRLAGDWQLASNTPRPRAWSDSWMSVQIHQSAFNNTMERLLPTGNAKSIEQFYTDTVQLFGHQAEKLPADVPGDAMIEFAATRPITIEIENGMLWLTLRVVSLSQPEGTALTRFIVRAGYRPEINGLDARLVRDGHLSISGPGMSMRERFPIRALFNKILSEQRHIPLTTPRLIEHPATQGLAISQLELRDGWIALAISPETTTRVAVGTRFGVNR